MVSGREISNVKLELLMIMRASRLMYTVQQIHSYIYYEPMNKPKLKFLVKEIGIEWNRNGTEIQQRKFILNIQAHSLMRH